MWFILLWFIVKGTTKYTESQSKLVAMVTYSNENLLKISNFESSRNKWLDVMDC